MFSITWINAQTLDVNFTGSYGNCQYYGGVSATYTRGQSFTAGISGNLTTVKVGISADACTETNTVNCVATLYSGTSCTGAFLTTQNFSIPAGSLLSMYPINFTNPASISSGQTYTLMLSVVSGQACRTSPSATPVLLRWRYENLNSCGGEYAGGTALNATCFPGINDHYIQTYVTVAGCTDVAACNYNASATVSNGSCTYASTWYIDTDVDGYGAGTATNACAQPTGYVTNSSDCNNSNAAVNPAATEICNSIDDDCDTQIDEGLTFTNYYADTDGDGFGAGAATNACAQPTGYVINNTDCNDTNAAISPTTLWYLNADGDGYYVSTIVSCTSPGANYNTTGGTLGDCNDTNAAVHTGATETCNGIDDDCDGMIDENSSNTY